MRILIIDDELNICISLKSILEDEGYFCDFAVNDKEGLQKVASLAPDIVLLDVKLGAANGLDVLQSIFEYNSSISVIMISGHSGIKEAVQAIKMGAFDFLEKPLSLTKVKIAVRNAYEYKTISTDYHRLRKNIDEQYQLIGKSQAMEDLKLLINKVARTDSKVLIRGESGTGKELVAYQIHYLSKRKEKPFVKFNSAAIPKELVESELFGYEKGAFTGAVKAKKGKIEQADGGTLFLDEIGDMDFNAQAKILRVIQEGEFERVGGNQTQRIDTRIIAATHKNLEMMVEEGQFREDLFYRLNVIPVVSPPLREHPEDIPELVDYFSQQFSHDLKIPLKVFSRDAILVMQSWQFKGNVRELKNCLERIYILSEKREIKAEDLVSSFEKESSINFWNETKQYKDKKREFEIRYLTAQLKLFDWNLSKTAEQLGLQVSNLSRKIKELEIM
jgi:two-component system, NtrC family, nitrogen regulation response regulator NtrX